MSELTISLRELREKWTWENGEPLDAEHAVLLALVEAVEAAGPAVKALIREYEKSDDPPMFSDPLPEGHWLLDARAALARFTEEGT